MFVRNISGDYSLSSSADENQALKNYMSSKKTGSLISFEDIRANVAALEDVEQGALHQALQDSGFTQYVL